MSIINIWVISLSTYVYFNQIENVNLEAFIFQSRIW